MDPLGAAAENDEREFLISGKPAKVDRKRLAQRSAALLAAVVGFARRSALGALGGAATQGFVADVSNPGIQHDATVGQAFQGGPLMDSDGKVVGINSRNFAPLGFHSDDVWWSPAIRDACDKILKCPSDKVTGAGDKR